MNSRSETLAADDGTSLRLTVRGSGREAAIVVVPGIFMHRESPEHLRLARALADLADVITTDVRGHGESAGRFSWGRKEPHDLQRVAAWAHERYARVGALGFSYGGYHTVAAAAQGANFDAVALVAAPKSLFLLDHNPFIRGLTRSVPIMLRRERRPARVSLRPPLRGTSPRRLIAQIVAPLLIVHGSDDWLIPVKHAHDLYALATEPKELVVIPGGLHAENILADDPEALIEPLRRFFASRL